MMGDEKRTRAMRDNFEKIYGVKPPSMGCKVVESFCSVCGGVVPECEHTRPLTEEETEEMRRKYLDAPRFEISWVKSPKCERCQTRMEPADSLHWACVNDDCDRKGISIHTGVYPSIPIKES